MQQLYICFLI